MHDIVISDQLHIFEELHILHIHCTGKWGLQSQGDIFEQLVAIGPIKKILLNAKKLESFSSTFLIFIQKLKRFAEERKCPLVMVNLPAGVKKIFNFSQREQPKVIRNDEGCGFFEAIGLFSIRLVRGLLANYRFFSAIGKSIWESFRGKSKGAWHRIIPFIQEVGVEALPIVALISWLVGLILAFVSVVQLERFGASIYVADLVGLAMTREMGCLMIGVILAGRTGASFAASIGSMQVNEELDALQTFGIDKMSYLVMPRVVALALMMPLLCIFADVIGILGGMITALPFSHGSITQYLLQTKNAVAMRDVLFGITKSFVFGIIVAGIGCYRGIKCGRNASAVGEASTAAVVEGITWLIVADALFAVLSTALGI